ncbi:hypothetical protein ARMGADRAFT_362702 [Armillaria gallica]|uniref:Uncharacterized protein n=1 Tax=Armillaria gallica TaxID=47427 RepID=A0A2H3DHP7_ARMGA|nr:hypothetical protein ARMGADRAFT_362702 [Armillaria gallica]
MFEALVGMLGQSGIDYFTTETTGEQDRWVNKVSGAPPGVSLDAERDFWVDKCEIHVSVYILLTRRECEAGATIRRLEGVQQMKRCARVAEDALRVDAGTG